MEEDRYIHFMRLILLPENSVQGLADEFNKTKKRGPEQKFDRAQLGPYFNSLRLDAEIQG